MKLTLPIFVILPRKRSAGKRYPLNLNSYRNTHFQILNQAKEIYHGLVRDAYMVASLKNGETMPPPPFELTYTFFPPSNRIYDLGNPLPIIGKFTEDALVELGLIIDDNSLIIKAINYRSGEVDRKNPRCELDIRTWLVNG